MARTAVVAGTATAVSNRVSRRQAGRWAAAEQRQSQYGYAGDQDRPNVAAPPAGAPPATPITDRRLAQLRELGELRAQGLLTDAEFDEQKARILDG